MVETQYLVHVSFREHSKLVEKLVVEIDTWTLSDVLCLNTVHCPILKCRFKLYSATKPYVILMDNHFYCTYPFWGTGLPY